MVSLLDKQNAALDKIRQQTDGFIFLYVGLAALSLVLALYGGLVFLNRAQESAKVELEEEVRLKEVELRPELTNQIFALEGRLKNLQTFLVNHLFMSNVLRFLESASHPQVRFFTFSFNADSRRLDMAGETISFLALAQQIGVLERDPMVEKVEFGGLSRSEKGLAGFKLGITFKPGLLQLRPQ